MGSLKGNPENVEFYQYKIPFNSQQSANADFFRGLIVKSDQRYRDIPISGLSVIKITELIKFYMKNPEKISLLPEQKSEMEKLRCNAIIFRNRENLSDLIMKAGSDGYRTVKIKISPAQSGYIRDELLKIIRSIRLNLRFDANRLFTRADRARLESLAELNPEYIEEPFENPDDSIEWIKRHPQIALAADESLRGNFLNEKKFSDAARIWIIKPALYKDRDILENICQKGKKLRKKLIFTSSMESDAGLQIAARWAAIYGPDETHGLDTFRYQKYNILNNMPSPEAGFFDMLQSPPDFNFEAMKVIKTDF